MCRCEVRRHLSHLGPDAHMCVPSASTSLETLDCIDPPISLCAFADCPSVSESLPLWKRIYQLPFNAPF